MINMNTAKCPKCGGIVFKLAGKEGELCHDLCTKCRKAETAALDEHRNIRRTA